MIVGVAEISLQHIVVGITDRQLCAHSRQAQSLELQVGHSAGGVLGEGLVDTQADLDAGLELAADEVFADDLGCQAVTHVCSLHGGLFGRTVCGRCRIRANGREEARRHVRREGKEPTDDCGPAD